MATESSDSSQVRRFDLYSIDARTQEFVRLSRKRQMRQGCACAAISTTITIFVIIGIILIYEFSTVSESPTRTTFTSDWLKLMNTSVNDLPFEVKSNKGKFGLDSATIKFLPLILKTLKKNKYFDRNIDDISNSSPTDKLQTTEEVYNRNIFSDTRNWMRMPTSRFYTVEYKTSPIVYFKNPTRNIDYYRKVRKIRDYQRIMNYVDKMISERVTFGSTVPLGKNLYSMSKNSAILEYTTPMTKVKDVKTKMQKISPDEIKNKASDRKPDCYCPKRMSEILKKLITGLQTLLPMFTDMNIQKPCSNNNSQITDTVQTKQVSKSQVESISKFDDTTTTVIKKIQFTIPSKKSVIYKSKPIKTLHSSPSSKLDYTLNNIIELLKPGIISRKRQFEDNKVISYKTITTKDCSERTKVVYKPEENITVPLNKDINVNSLPNSVLTAGDYILKKNINKTKPSYSILTEREYEDYIDTTSKIVTNYKKQEDLESMESKIMTNINYQESPRINVGESTDSYTTISPNSLSKLSERVSSSTFPTIDNNFIASWKLNDSTISLSSEVAIKSNGKSKLSPSLPVKETFKMEQILKSEDITLEEELNKTMLDDITPEENVNHLKDIIKPLNSSELHNTITETSKLFEWELVNVDDYTNNYNIVNSMIPHNKASYLEIQRNDWKPEEHQDYDNNINNYFFE